MRVVNKETKEVYKFMVNTEVFVYGTIGTHNQVAEVGDYLIIDDEDKLVEVVNEAEFAEKYEEK